MFKKSTFLLNIIFLFMATSFSINVSAEHWADEVLRDASKSGLIDYYSNSTDFRADENITRAEFMYYINRMKGYDLRSPRVNNYYDVSPSDWYYDTVSVALAAGYISGVSDNKMSPNRAIKREEAMAILTRIYSSSSYGNSYRYAKDGYTVSNWAKSSVSACINEGFISGHEGNINPHSFISRAEAIVMLSRVNSDVRVFALPGQYNFNNRKVKNVEIYAPSVLIKDIKVKENFKIQKGIEGKVSIENALIEKNIELASGELDLDNVIVKDDINVLDAILEINGKSQIENINLSAGSKLINKAKDYKKIEKVKIDKDADDAKVEIRGDFYRVESDADYVTLKARGEIDKLYLNDDIKIMGDLRVNYLSKDRSKIRVKIMDEDGDYEYLSEYKSSFTVDSGDYEDEDDDDDKADEEDDDEDKYESQARKFEKKHRDILEKNLYSITLNDRWDINYAVEDYEDLHRKAKKEVDRYYVRKLDRLINRIKELKDQTTTSTTTTTTQSTTQSTT